VADQPSSGLVHGPTLTPRATEGKREIIALAGVYRTRQAPAMERRLLHPWPGWFVDWR